MHSDVIIYMTHMNYAFIYLVFCALSALQVNLLNSINDNFEQ